MKKCEIKISNLKVKLFVSRLIVLSFLLFPSSSFAFSFDDFTSVFPVKETKDEFILFFQDYNNQVLKPTQEKGKKILQTTVEKIKNIENPFLPFGQNILIPAGEEVDHLVSEYKNNWNQFSNLIKENSNIARARVSQSASVVNTTKIKDKKVATQATSKNTSNNSNNNSSKTNPVANTQGNKKLAVTTLKNNPNTSPVTILNNPTPSISESQLISALEKLFSKKIPDNVLAKLKGPKGDQGPQGLQGPQGVQGSVGTDSMYPFKSTYVSSPVSSPAPIQNAFILGGVVPPNPSANFSGATLLSATNLSSTSFDTGTATVDTLTVSGSTSLSSLSISGDLIVSGSVTGALPSQTGNSGKYLTTDGTTASWGTVASGGSWGSITGTLSAQTDLQSALDLKSNIASPTFTGTVTIPTPFTLGATSVTTTGTQLNYLASATGTTGTTSTNLVFSTSPTLVTPTLGVATATSINGLTLTSSTGVLTITNAKTFSVSNTLTFAGTDGSTLDIGTGGTLGTNAYTSTAYAPIASPTFTGTVTIPTPFTLGATSVTATGTQLNYLASATGTTGTTSTNLVFSTSPTLTTPLISGGTLGSVYFAGTSGLITQDNSNFFWDDTNNRLGIGTASPSYPLDVLGNARIGSGSGDVTFYANGTGIVLNINGSNKARFAYSSNDFYIQNVNTSANIYLSGNSGSDLTGNIILKLSGNVGIGTTSPTAKLHLPAGTTSASSAPLKFTSGSLLTTAEAGAVEFLTDAFYGTITTGEARKTFAFLESPSFTTPALGSATATGLALTSANTTEVTTASALALNANSLTTGTGFYAASSSLTSGSLVDLQVSGTAAAASQTALNILTAGATATNAITTYGAQISNTHTNATSGTNVALYLNASGATTANYGLIVNEGSVGIGTTSPSSKLDVTTAGLGTTQADTSGFSLVNTTAATVGAQQISPAMRWRGYGWKTASTAASQSVDFRAYVLPVQASSAPTANWILQYSVNGGAYADTFIVKSDSTAQFGSSASNFISASSDNATAANGGVTMLYKGHATSTNNVFSHAFISSTRSGTTGTIGMMKLTQAWTPSASSSADYNGLSVNYTINAAAGAASGTGTGILVNATETSLNGLTHNLLDLQVASTSKFKVTNAGFVGIAQTTPAIQLHVGSSSITDATSLLRLQDANSTCDFTADSGSPSCGSDLTLKKDINSLNTNDLLSKISSLNPVSYRWLTDANDSNLQHGFIAQEVALQFPELVTDHTWIDGTTRKFLNTGGLMPYVIGAIKELNNKISSLSDTIKSYLADAGNGIEDLFANRVHTKELCVGDGNTETCITKAQLDSLLGSQNLQANVNNNSSSGTETQNDNSNTEIIPEDVNTNTEIPPEELPVFDPPIEPSLDQSPDTSTDVRVIDLTPIPNAGSIEENVTEI